MTAKTKKANWSDSQVERLVELFTSTGDYAEQKELSENLALDKDFSGKTERAILGKVQHLSRSGITCPLVEGFEYRENTALYLNKVYKTKQNVDTIRKSTLVSHIASLLMQSGNLVDSSVADSLESATKPILEVLVSALTIPEQEDELAE